MDAFKKLTRGRFRAVDSVRVTQVPNYAADAFFTAINLSLHRVTCTHQSTHLEIELC